MSLELDTSPRSVDVEVDVAAPLAVDDCPICSLTDATRCPACNGSGTLVVRVADPDDAADTADGTARRR